MAIKSNKAQCRKCGDTIESMHRHDFRTCSCDSISVDGGKDYLKRNFIDINDIIELSEFKEENTDKNVLQVDDFVFKMLLKTRGVKSLYLTDSYILGCAKCVLADGFSYPENKYSEVVELYKKQVKVLFRLDIS